MGEPTLSDKRGESIYYCELVIATMATVRSVYNLPGRQCQGFIESIFELMGLELSVPEHSTLSLNATVSEICF